MEQRGTTFPLVGGGMLHQGFGVTDIELRVQLVDYDGRGMNYDAVRLIEQAIEQVLNGPPPVKPVPLGVALPLDPRKITL